MKDLLVGSESVARGQFLSIRAGINSKPISPTHFTQSLALVNLQIFADHHSESQGNWA
jgi:hypothetical protein